MRRRCGSAVHAGSVAVLAACALAGVALAQTPAQPAETPAPAAQPAPAPAVLQGDPHRGRELSYTCLGCHGIDGYRNAYPDYSVPKLGGQSPEYLMSSLHDYRKGDRSPLR